MSEYPEARAAASVAQRALSRFSGLHMTPEEWLHVTAFVAGSTGEISRGQMALMLDRAGSALSGFEPISVTLDRVLYHPEAVMLAVEPADPLRLVQDVIRDVTASIRGQGLAEIETCPEWIPHVTVSYSTAEQEAAPIISALGKSIDPRRVVIDAVSLVVQWGPERLWDWERVGTIHLG